VYSLHSISVLKVKYIINTLIHVNNSNNSIGGIGATSISKALMHNQTMKVLKLENNMLRHDEAMALADSLQINTSLTNINLGVNIIGRRGSFAIANA
jgi:Ran GTPase-activating protein (RanGAP) involved in mRNA processing and transport